MKTEGVCPAGHPHTPETYVQYPSMTSPQCLICKRARCRRWRQAHKAQVNAYMRERRARDRGYVDG